MSSLNISVPESLRKFIEQRTKETNHSTPTKYIRSLIREDQRRAKNKGLTKLLQEGLDSGPATEMTSEDWADIKREVQARLAAQPKRAKAS